jgi:hypothetical protein
MYGDITEDVGDAGKVRTMYINLHFMVLVVTFAHTLPHTGSYLYFVQHWAEIFVNGDRLANVRKVPGK